MFPAAPAAPFARNVACRGVLVIHFSDFQDLLRFVTFSYVVHSRSRICTPFTRNTRVLREYYVRKANYARLRVTYACLRVTELINIHRYR